MKPVIKFICLNVVRTGHTEMCGTGVCLKMIRADNNNADLVSYELCSTAHAWHLVCFSMVQVTLHFAVLPLAACSGVVVSVVHRMNEVTLRRSRLVSGLVTVFGLVYHHGT